MSKLPHCCSQCSFTAQFESALTMHHQLHHESPDVEDYMNVTAKAKACTLPLSSLEPPRYARKDKGLKLATKTASATRLLGKLRARICRSKTLFAHPEENADLGIHINECDASECTSKALKENSILSQNSVMTTCLKDLKEVYSCHLCDFDADRITVLDRHLLNDHKIGLENLLKLVMAKTQDGLNEDGLNPLIYGLRQAYYRITDRIIEQGEFVIETVTPKIKILKHAATNTDIQWADIPNLKDNCRMITKELDKLLNYPAVESFEKDQLLNKMATLNECMCKFVDSSNTLKKVLTREFDSARGRDHLSGDEPMFDLGLGDQDTSRDWGRAHSEKLEPNRSRKKYGESPSRSDKDRKLCAESYYF